MHIYYLPKIDLFLSDSALSSLCDDIIVCNYFDPISSSQSRIPDYVLLARKEIQSFTYP